MTMIITSSNTKTPTTNAHQQHQHHHYLASNTNGTLQQHQQHVNSYHVTTQSNTNNNSHNAHYSESSTTTNNGHTTAATTSNSPPSPSLLASSRGVSLSPVNFPSYIPHPSNINNLLLFSKKSLLQHHHQYMQQQQVVVNGRNFHVGTDLGVEKFDRKINGNQSTRSTLSLNSPLKVQTGSTYGQGKTMGIISASEKCFSHKSTTNTSSAFSKRTPQSSTLNTSQSTNKIRGSFDSKIDSILSSIDNETQKDTSTSQTSTKKKTLSSIIFEEIANDATTSSKKRKFDETTDSTTTSSSFQKVLDPPKKKKSLDEITAENMYEGLLNKCRKNYIPQLQSINAITVAEEVTENGSNGTAISSTSCEVVPIISNEQLNLVVGNQLCSLAGPLTQQDKSIMRFIETNPINDFVLEFLENKKFTGF